MKIDLTKTAPENCLHFQECEVNDCPLEKQPNKFQTLPEDKKLYNFHKCRCTKKKRMDIGKAYKMKSLGMTLKELANMKRSMEMKKQMFSTRVKNTNTPSASVQMEERE